MGKIKDILFKVFRTHPFITGFLLPILTVLVLNIGLIFKWSLWLNREPIISIVEFLSIKKIYDLPAAFFIGIITIFILFFSFAQFSYSRQALPANLVRKHILAHHNTYLFIGLQFAFSTIIAFFTFINAYSIHNLNFIIILVLLLSSVLISLVYFYWLVRNVTSIGMFLLIISSLNFDEIRQIAKSTQMNIEKFNSNLLKIKLLLKYSTFNFFVSSNQILPIQSEKKGIITEIDILTIDNLLSEFGDIIKEIFMDVQIGQRIPIYDPYPGITSKTNLLRIFVSDSTNPRVLELETRLNEKLNQELINCFHIEKKSYIYEINRDNLLDLVQFYIYAVEADSAETEKLVEQFSGFILSEVSSLETGAIIDSVEKLFLDIIEIFEQKLRFEGITLAKIEMTLTFVYSMRNVAIKRKSYLMISKLLSLLTHLFARYINSEHVLSNRIDSFILYIQEVAFSEIVYSGEYTDKRTLFQYYKSFYLPLIGYALERAASTFYILIKASTKNEKEFLRILIENGQHFINFLSPLNHWDPIEELAFENSLRFKVESKNILNIHAENILHLAILIFKYVKEKKLPSNYINEIAFPLVNNCQTVNKYKIKSEELLDEYFFSDEYKGITSSIFREEFEVNKIHESGTYSPITYSFRDFWLTYSLYREFYPIYLTHSEKSFIPSHDTDKSRISKSMIHSMINRLQSISVKDLANWLNKDENTIREVMMKYGAHLRTLYNQKPEDSKGKISGD